MATARFPKFLSVLLLALPAQADIILCGGLGGYCSFTHEEDCIMLKADGSRRTERCTVYASVSGFLKSKPERKVVHQLYGIRFGEGPSAITHKVLDNARFYADNKLQRSEKEEDTYLCIENAIPDTAICPDAAQIYTYWN